MIALHVNEEFKGLFSEEKLHMAALAVFAQQNKPHDTMITIVISDDEQLHQLNQQFLGENRTTDVLSFPSGEIDPETQQQYLGDIIISFPQAKKQAAASGHDVEDELQLLVVHACLHLLGFDHSSEQEKKDMWAAQKEILNLLGVHTNLME